MAIEGINDGERKSRKIEHWWRGETMSWINGEVKKSSICTLIPWEMKRWGGGEGERALEMKACEREKNETCEREK
jgi:hypothetical protein